MTTPLSKFKQLFTSAIVWVIQKELVIESFAVTDMTTVASAVLFRSESKGSGFHANERR